MRGAGARAVGGLRRMATAAGLAALLGATAPSSCGLYALGPGSRVVEGCFAPCMCPIGIDDALHGFLVLEPVAGNPADPVRHFEVLWVRWTYEFATGEPLWVTGSGTYDVGGEFAIAQRLALDLAVGDEPVAHYDSGTVPGGSTADRFPPIDVAISRNGQRCYDRVFTLHAAPLL